MSSISQRVRVMVRGSKRGKARDEPLTPKVVFQLFRYHGFNCHYCSRCLTIDELQLDHKIPLSKGGDNSFENLVVCCATCNNAKEGEVMTGSSTATRL